MREIKFRAWDTFNDEWAKPNKLDNLIVNYSMLGDGIFELQDDSHDMRGHGDFLIEQFTGLHDKNGVEIYEGDILEFVFDGKKYTTNPVRWKNEYGFYIAGITIGEWEPEDILYGEYEIIGNIHKNSELLGEE